MTAPANYYPLVGETSRLDAGLNSSALPRALGLNANDSGKAIASQRVPLSMISKQKTDHRTKLGRVCILAN